MLNLVRDRLLDNPVFAKDAALTLRHKSAPLAVVIAGLVVWFVALVVHGTVEPNVDQLASYAQGLHASGRAMFSAVTIALLALETLLLPALASSTIAGERERGTLPLLTVSALSPARIVAGKVAALLAVSAPIFLCSLPLLALASIYGGVSVVEVVGALALLAVHGFALVSTGVGASSLVKRSRAAAPLAMMFAVVPTLLAGLPELIGLVAYGAGEDTSPLAPLLVVGALAESCVAAAALLLARAQLSPRSAPRFALRRVVVAAILVALPLVAALALRFGHDADRSLEEGVAVASILEVAVLAFGAALFEMCLATSSIPSRGRGSAGARHESTASRRRGLLVAALGAGAHRRGLLVAALGATGLVVAHVVADDRFYARLSWAGVALLAVHFAFVAFLGAAVSRFVSSPPLRLVLTVAVLGVIFFAPIALHEFRALLGLHGYPLGFMNVAYALDEMHAPYASSLAFFAFSTFLLAVLSRVRAR